MSSPAPNRDDIAVALKTYACSLEERNAVLADLAQVSREMRSMLETDSAADIRDVLARREQECLRYASLCTGQTMSDEVLIRRAQDAACCGDSGLSSLGVSVLSLYEDAQMMAEEIMGCQGECESILRTRLQATSKALKQSAQRRRLDAVYGPAHRHDVPVFMDHKK